MKFKVREAKLLEHIYEKGAEGEEYSLPGQTVVKAGEGERKREQQRDSASEQMKAEST